jgi:hypothetical protein
MTVHVVPVPGAPICVLPQQIAAWRNQVRPVPAARSLRYWRAVVLIEDAAKSSGQCRSCPASDTNLADRADCAGKCSARRVALCVAEQVVDNAGHFDWIGDLAFRRQLNLRSRRPSAGIAIQRQRIRIRVRAETSASVGWSCSASSWSTDPHDLASLASG